MIIPTRTVIIPSRGCGFRGTTIENSTEVSYIHEKKLWGERTVAGAEKATKSVRGSVSQGRSATYDL